MIAITAATLFTPLERIEQPLLLVEDGFIVEVTSRAQRDVPAGSREVDFPGGILAPGFIDMHIHGGAGHDVMEGGAGALAASGASAGAARREQLLPYDGDCPAGCNPLRAGAAGGRG